MIEASRRVVVPARPHHTHETPSLRAGMSNREDF
jgi:hypothetical protein